MTLKNTAIAEQASYDALIDLLVTAVHQLQRLGTDPVALAASMHRYDGTGYFPWSAVRVGNASHEYGRLMAGPTLPTSLHEASLILRALEASGWRGLFSRAYNFSFDDRILALVLERGKAWLAFSRTRSRIGGDELFEIRPGQGLIYTGECTERLDLRILDCRETTLLNLLSDPEGWPPYSRSTYVLSFDNPLTDEHFGNSKTLPLLEPKGLPRRTADAVARQPAYVTRTPLPPTIVDEAAHDHLKSILHDAALQLSALGPQPIIMTESQNRFDDTGHRAWTFLRIGDQSLENEEYQVGRAQAARQAPAQVEVMRRANAILKSVESKHWKALFAKAFELSFGDHIMSLVIQEELAWLVFCGTMYSSEEYAFSLWCDAPIEYFGQCKERFDWEQVEDFGPSPLKFRINQ